MDDLELIKQKLNIVDLISEYLPLKKAGVNYKANCPFHQERTPSFMVSPERGIWHCFGCEKGGDHFKFLMEKEGIEFKDALEILAKKTGVVLKRSRKKDDRIDRLYQINQKAQQFFSHILIKHKLGGNALRYLRQRGLKDETIDKFGLGYSPQSWDSLTKFLNKRGFSKEEMIQSGLCVPSRIACYDRFRGRVMFPLFDVQDRIIGFSGRILNTGEPKYINTPQTPIFDKKRLLFGLNMAKSQIRQTKEAILVEGEMDMIMSYQSGIENVVASKGTALTEEQVEILKKNAQDLSLCFDTDLAGDAASRRGIEIADRAGLNLKVVNLENAKDPAEVCKSNPNIWQGAVSASIPIYDYYLQSAERRFSTKAASGKRAVFSELLPIWKKISDPITKEHYIQKLSALLQIKDDLLRKEMARTSILENQARSIVTLKTSPQENNSNNSMTRKIEPADRRKLLEKYLVSLLLHIPSTHTYVPNFPETLLTQEDLKQVYVLLVIFLDRILFKAKAFRINEFTETLPPELAETVDRLYLIELDGKLSGDQVWQKEIETVTLELKKLLVKTSLEKLSLQIKKAQEFDNLDKLGILNKKFRDLSIKLKNL